MAVTQIGNWICILHAPSPSGTGPQCFSGSSVQQQSTPTSILSLSLQNIIDYRFLNTPQRFNGRPIAETQHPHYPYLDNFRLPWFNPR